MIEKADNQHRLSRRELLQGIAAGALASLVPTAVKAQPLKPKFLIVFTGTGGASLLDSTLAIRASESANAEIINTYSDQDVLTIDGTPFRALDLNGVVLNPLPARIDTNQSTFFNRHSNDILAVTHTGTSVNHLIAQKRSVTGNDAWAGRTLQEAVAQQYGQGFPLPNINMGTGGFVEPGLDPSISELARSQLVTNPSLFFAGLHSSKGNQGAPRPELVELARTLRDDVLDESSIFGRTFHRSPAIELWKQQRTSARTIEEADLITRLNMLREQPSTPLNAFGLLPSRDANRVRQVFPDIDEDPLAAQAALAYLLIKNRVSVSVTLGPGLTPDVSVAGFGLDVKTTPLAFDFSHSNHRGAQALMWSRLLSVAERLIGLLKETPFDEDGSFWDQTVIYFATEFGRTRNRPAGSTTFGSGHHLNNGSLIVSPLANGNQILGGVDPNTGLTYGHDPQTGEPDPNREMTETEIFGGLCQMLELDTASAPRMFTDMVSMRRR